MAFYIYKSPNNGQWYWYLVAANGKKIADSGEGYWNESDCLNGIGMVMGATQHTPVYRR